MEKLKKDEAEQVKRSVTTFRLSDKTNKNIDFGVTMENMKNRREFMELLVDRWSRININEKKLEDIIEKEEKTANELNNIKQQRKEMAILINDGEKENKNKQIKIIRAIKILKNKMKNGSREEINTIAEYWEKQTGLNKDKLINMAKE